MLRTRVDVDDANDRLVMLTPAHLIEPAFWPFGSWVALYGAMRHDDRATPARQREGQSEHARAKRRSGGSRRRLPAVVIGAGLLVSTLSTSPAVSADPPIAIGEVTPPPPSTGIDEAVLRDAAEGELRQLDASRFKRRRVVVSIAMTQAIVQGPVACTVNAMLRDAKTGAMIAIIEAGASADGPGSVELRRRVAYAAVRSAVRRIPGALGAQ